ncbi:MAG: hypothetical protein HY070_10745 [Chloroflexi bacterium]|nr:hypothetical protein [Chloroflexota bacterium]
MDALISLLRSTIAGEQARQLALLLLFLPLFFFSYWAIKRGAHISLRAIPAYDALKRLLAHAAEAGQPMHLALGTGGIGDQSTADTMAGLTVLEYLAERAAISATPPIVTMANPTALPVAQDFLRRAYSRQGYPEEYDPARARFIAPNPALTSGGEAIAYGAGAMRLLARHGLIANVMIGRFGDEFLLLSETGAQRGITQIGGTSSERVLPFVRATVDYPLIGEEIYAGGAYLSNKPGHISSLLAQDLMRGLLVAGLILAVVLKTLGVIQ